MIQIYKSKESVDEKQQITEVRVEEILPGACDRASVKQVFIPSDGQWNPEVFSWPENTQMILFISGSGYVATGSKAFNITKPALFVPDYDRYPIHIQAGREGLKLIQIVSRMNPEDCKWIQKSHMVFPKFKNFEDAWEVDMRVVNSPGCNSHCYLLIENRKLGANNMGIFESDEGKSSMVLEGPQPTYDQFAIALEGENCILTSDGREDIFAAGDVAFIPHGDPVGFKANEKGKIHHVWFTLNRAFDV